MTCLINILFLISLSLYTARLSEAVCTAGWFGTNCMYKCHCSDTKCNAATGECATACASGWFGPACQYQDLAQNATFSTQNKLIDNNDSTCVTVRSITFEWPWQFVLTWIRINSTDLSWQSDVNVRGKENINATSKALSCSLYAYILNNKTTSDVFCISDILIDRLTIDFGKNISVCTIYISGGRNVALQQSTTQSTNSTASTPAKNAVDGSLATSSQTSAANLSTWSVTFYNTYIVNRYVLTGDSGKLNGYQLQLFSADNSFIHNYTDTNTLATTKVYVSSSTLQNVKTARITYNTSLKLFEVEIYGDSDCKAYTYGIGCNKTCNCKDTAETCFVATGGCRSGCAAGYQGEGCQTPCNPSRFGPNCINSCSSNCNISLCNSTNGFCFKCNIGYTGDFCENICVQDKWGIDCIQSCNTKCINSSCNPFNGSCTSGCLSGYTGAKCESNCTTGWFGHECRYKCRCIGTSCDFRTGECSAGCLKGFFGPSCQYQDLAQTASVTPRNTSLTDNNDTSCVGIQNVTLEWTFSFVLTWIRINTKDSPLMSTTKIIIRGVNKTSKEISCLQYFTNSNKTTTELVCYSNDTINFLALELGTNAQICSIFISGGRNVAIKQSAIQSTTTSPYVAGLAVDGDITNVLSKGYCSSTTATKPFYWNVTLYNAIYVNRFVLYRESSQKLNGFTLEVIDPNNKVSYSYTDNTSLTNVTVYTIATPRQLVKAVRINYTARLTLCEVELYGESICSDNTYGLECNRTCNCKDTAETCFVFTGGCRSGCAAGYLGEGCDTPCDNTHYGYNCASVCPSRCDTAGCNKTTGKCFGCVAGYKGDNCDVVCNAGSWGVGCKNTCPNCVVMNCNNTDGVCLNGCESGFKGRMCDSKCDETYYGDNCAYNCSADCYKSLCDYINGYCKSCRPGFQGEFCNYKCSEMFYGPNCVNKCNETCLRCNNVNGTCTLCTAGKRGIYCESDCESGTYGINCTNICSSNCRGSLCDSVNGVCKSCNQGYKGDFCNTPCAGNEFGFNCNGTCSGNCDRNKCDGINGTCSYGCVAGYRGNLCDQACSIGSYGIGCKHNCSTSCIKYVNTTERWCDVTTGICFNGCYEGDVKNKSECQKLIAEPPNDTSAAVIVVPIVLILIFICLIVAFVFWRRSKMGLCGRNKHSALDNISHDLRSLDDFDNTKDISSTEGDTETKCNTSNEDTPIDVSKLYFFMCNHNRDYFIEQFKRIPYPANVSTIVADCEDNKNKNRYRNIRAYDHSRVHLEINTKNNEGDYINASYLEGYKNQEKFIASQGPCASMLNDFIRMLWEQKVEKVIMLTNLIEEGKNKCLKYWPDEGKEKFGDIKVKLAATHVFADYTIRKLELIKKNQPTHSLTHFHFTSWPDKGVPATPWSLVDFEQRVAMEESIGPMVVHCSAGVGRTGTFIALRNVMREAEDTGVVNFFRTVSKLRQDRMMMIQTAEQYEFLHKAAQVAIVCMGTTVTSRDIESRISFLQEGQTSGKSQMESEFKAVSALCDYLCTAKKTEKMDERDTNVYLNGDTLADTELNKELANMPDINFRTKLERESLSLRDYINAVIVPSFTKPDGQILTQLPTATTVIDFWRLVMQYNIALVLAFETNSNSKDLKTEQYLPESITEPLSCGLYEVTTGPIRNEDQCEIQNVMVKSKKKKNILSQMSNSHSLTHITLNDLTLDPKNWLNLIKKARANNTHGRILYMCRDGVTYSGLACVLNLLLDRLDHDQSLTVPLVVGAVKCIRPQVISTLDQYNCLYQVLQRYNETSSSYNNYDYPMVEKKFKPPRHIPQPIFDDVQYSNTS